MILVVEVSDQEGGAPALVPNAGTSLRGRLSADDSTVDGIPVLDDRV